MYRITAIGEHPGTGAVLAGNTPRKPPAGGQIAQAADDLPPRPSIVRFELPYPPSVNHYFRQFIFRGQSRTLISLQGREFRERVCGILRRAHTQPQSGNLCVKVDIYPPDHRRRDLDNTLKALLDALQHGGAFHDDSQIVWLLTEKADVIPGGKVIVSIWPRLRIAAAAAMTMEEAAA